MNAISALGSSKRYYMVKPDGGSEYDITFDRHADRSGRAV
jgi:hypothetical protein